MNKTIVHKFPMYVYIYINNIYIYISYITILCIMFRCSMAIYTSAWLTSPCFRPWSCCPFAGTIWSNVYPRSTCHLAEAMENHQFRPWVTSCGSGIGWISAGVPTLWASLSSDSGGHFLWDLGNWTNWMNSFSMNSFFWLCLDMYIYILYIL